MTSATLDQAALDQQRADLASDLADKKAELPRLAASAASGDEAAEARYVELQTDIAQLEHRLGMLAHAGVHLDTVRADERARAAEAKRRADAQERQRIEAEYQAALRERDALVSTELDALIGATLALFTKAIDAGKRIDALRAQTGRPGEPIPQWVDTPRRMAARVRGVLGLELSRTAAPLAFAFGEGPLNAESIPSLSSPPAPRTIDTPPDRFSRREFPIAGEHIRGVEDAVLPSPLPGAQ